MLLDSMLLEGRTDVITFLQGIKADVKAGHLIALPADFAHREGSAQFINTRYLDQRTHDIFRLKGRVNETAGQFHLERQVTRTKRTAPDGTSTALSRYGFRFMKHPLFGEAMLQLDWSPQLPDSRLATLRIDLSGAHIPPQDSMNPRIIEAVILNAITRSFTFRTNLFSAATLQVQSIRIHHIDTGYDTVEYVIRRCIDQVFDTGGDEPTAGFEGGLVVKRPSWRMGALTVEVVGEIN